MKYVGFNLKSNSSGLCAKKDFKKNLMPGEKAKIVFEIDVDHYEDAAEAWNKFRFGPKASYNPICLADCYYKDPKNPGHLLNKKSCKLCRGKGYTTMEVWRANKDKYAN